MESSRKRVLLTGASGSMGHEAFLELRRRSPEYAVKLLLRPSKVNKKMFAPYEGETNWLEIVWGDLTSPEDVKRAVSGVEYVLHPAAMISPAADHHPEMARRVNVGAAENLLAAIRSEPDGLDRIHLVNIGSVAQYGDRLPPIENIKVGDPLKPSKYDYYALTKCDAETMVIESGMKYWASMRQTFICIPNLMSLLDPILFHQPLEQRIEFITSRDAGYGLVQTLEAKDSYWQRIYNMSGGPSCRIKYADFMNTLFGRMGMGNVEELFERNWFALRNFHCGYYEDSWELDAELGHFRDTKEDFFEQAERAAAAWMKVGARLAPASLLKRLARRYAEPLQWIENNDEGKINAFFGSRKAWEEIPGWDGSYRG